MGANNPSPQDDKGLVGAALSNAVGVLILGLVALACVGGVIYVAVEKPATSRTETTIPAEPPAAGGTVGESGGGGAGARETTETETQQTAGQQASAEPATTKTTDSDPTALAVLATIASAAAGGIAGFLTGRRAS